MGVTLSDSRVVKVRGPNTSSIVALSSVRTSSRRSICRAKRDPVGKATVRVSPSSDSGTALASREPLAALALRTLSTTWRHLRCRSEALRCAAGCGAGAGAGAGVGTGTGAGAGFGAGFGAGAGAGAGCLIGS